MNIFRTSLVVGAIAALAIGLNSCSPSSDRYPGDSAAAEPNQPATAKTDDQVSDKIASRRSLNVPSEELIARPTDDTAARVSVTIYNLDNQCEALVPDEVQVPATKALEAAIGEVLEREETADFSLAGYRVSVNGNTATIDLRLATNSKRKFASLSSCEQLGLFGSLKKTLTENPDWNIKTVRFTERGQQIVL